MIQTEFEFELPKGLLLDDGVLHRHGRMRLATGADEILPLKEPRVQANPAYLICILLSRVVRFDGMDEGELKPPHLERMFVEDLRFLQRFYNRINGTGEPGATSCTCPKCGEEFEVEREQSLGGSLATP